MKNLDLADFISRSDKLLSKCNNDCKLCVEVMQNGMIKDDTHNMLLEDSLEISQFVPQMSIDRFEEIFKIEKIGSFNRAYSDATTEMEIKFEDEEEEIGMMVTRQRTKNLEKRKRGPRQSHEQDNKILYEIIDQKGWTELMNDNKTLREIQMKDKTLRITIEAKEGGRLPGPKDRPSETLRTDNTIMVKGTLRKERIMVGVKIVSPIVIPEDMVFVFVKKIHKSFGCGTATRLKNLCRTSIWGKLLTKHAEDVTRTCRDCAYLRMPAKIIKESKEHSDRWPEHVGQTFLADVITRKTTTDRKAQPETTMKFHVVSEAITGYLKMNHVSNKENNAEKGREILTKALHDMACRPHGTLQKTIVMDGAPVNVKISKDPIWEDINTKIKILDKMSNSKNYLAPLDSRMQKLSKYLNQEIGKKASPELVALRVCDRYNSTPGATGYSPAELWFGTSQQDGKRIEVDMELVKSKVKETCRLAREADDRLNSRSRRRLPIDLKPYEEGDLYRSDLESPIKTGDLILIEGVEG
jgi:hypothetical protein